MRIGIGYDIHRLVHTEEKSSIRLGSVDIPCFFKLKAHSDGDVLLHALVDSLLGALALGDIGTWFPDNLEENRDRASREFVAKAYAHIKSMGWRVINLDAIVFAEEPKLSPHWDTIRREIARLLEIELSAVSLKAKTMEGLGPIGGRKAIAAQTVVLLEPVSP